MKPRGTLLLVCVAAALFAFIYFVDRHPRPVNHGGPGPVLPALKPAAVSAVQAQAAGQPEVSLERTNDSWRIVSPITAPARAAVVTNLLQALAGLNWHSRLTEADLEEHADANHDFGFAPPQYTFNFQQDGQPMKVLLGSRTPFGDELFLRVDDQKEIYVVDVSLLKFVPPTPEDWRDPALVSLNGLVFNRLIVTNGSKVFELQRNGTNHLWSVTRPVQARADSPKVDDLIAQLAKLRVSHFVTDDPKPDLDSFGLLPPALTLDLAQDSNDVLTLDFGKNPTNSDTEVYVRRSDQNGIALTGTEATAPWSGSYEDFRDRRLLDLAAEPPGEIEVHGADNFTVQFQSNDVWRILPPDNFPVDAGLMRGFLGSLAELQATQFVKTVVTEPDLPNYNLAPPALSFILKPVDTNLAPVQLDFSAPQDGKVYARRSDETCVYALPAGELASLPDAGWKLRERQIWDFSETNVTAITLHQNGQMRQLLHSGTNEWAFASGSQGVINVFAAEEASHRLGGLTVTAWVAHNETNLAPFGVTSNSLQLDLAVKQSGQTNTFSLQLGGVSSNQLYYAATTLGDDYFVFELPPQLGELIHIYLAQPAGP